MLKKMDNLKINNGTFKGIVIGSMKLPGGNGGEGIMKKITEYLNVKTLNRFIQTSIIKQLSNAYGWEYLNNICQQRIETRRIEIIKSLNEKYNKAPRLKVSHAPTPFIVACELGYVKDVKCFIETCHVTDVNMKGRKSDGHGGYRALLIAVLRDQLNVVEYLLSIPSLDISIVNDTGMNCLHTAAQYNRARARQQLTETDILKLILNHPKCTSLPKKNLINFKDQQGKTPMNRASSHAKKKMLREHGGVANMAWE